MTDIHDDAIATAPAATPASAAPNDTAERLQAALRGRVVQDAWRIAAALVIAALAVGVLSAIALNIVIGALNLPTTVKQYTSAVSSPFAVVLIAALALGGQLTLTGGYTATSGTGSDTISNLLQSAAATAGASGTATLTPLLLSAVVLVAVAVWTRRVLVRAGGAPGTWWATGLTAGGMAAVAMEALAGITTLHPTFAGFSVSATATGWRLFVGTVVVALVGTWAGYATRRFSRSAGADPRIVVLTAFAAFGARWRGLIATVVTFSLVFTAVALVGAVIAAMNTPNPVAVLATLPLTLGPAALAAGVLGQFGELDASYGASSSTFSSSPANSMSLSVLSGPGWLWLTVLGAIVATAVTAFVLRDLEPENTGSTRRLWVLPLELAALWLIVPFAVGTISGDVTGSVLVFSGTASGSGSVAGWFFLFAAGTGLLIELIARYVLPAWAGGNGGDRSTRIASVVVGGTAVAAVLFAITVAALNATLFSPTAAVHAYTDAISHGDVRAASTAVAADARKQSALPVPDLDGRLKTVSTTVDSSTDSGAEVKLVYRVAAHQSTAYLSVSKAPALFGLFDQWRVNTSLLGQVQIQDPITADVTIAGVPFRKQTGTLWAAAYPGTYSLAVTGASGRYVTVGKATILGQDQVAATERPSAALAGAVTAKLKATLDACVPTATAVDPDDCPVSDTDANYIDPDSVRNVSWSITGYPVATVHGNAYSTTTCGTATVQFQSAGWFGGWSDESGSDDCVGGNGTVQVANGAVTLTADDEN